LTDEVNQLKDIASKMVGEGMQILRNNLFDPESEKKAFQLFKNAADVHNDVEACWRVAACYVNSIGTHKDLNQGKLYAKTAMDNGSVDGIFWYGLCQDKPEDQFQFFKQASDRNHLPGKYWVGFSNSTGRGIEKNETNGKLVLEQVFNSGDRFWSFTNAYCFENGLYGFETHLNQANQLYSKSKIQPLSDQSVFRPFNFDLDVLRIKFL
jgi:TPR repeat protein